MLVLGLGLGLGFGSGLGIDSPLSQILGVPRKGPHVSPLAGKLGPRVQSADVKHCCISLPHAVLAQRHHHGFALRVLSFPLLMAVLKCQGLQMFPCLEDLRDTCAGNLGPSGMKVPAHEMAQLMPRVLEYGKMELQK